MPKSLTFSAGLLILTLGTTSQIAQPPPGTAVSLTLHEGTSMAAALSPDGATVAIDLLGTLWSLPASGGAARQLTDEAMDVRMPAWSPDGRRLAFQGYRSTTWQIWTVGADGTGLRAETGGPFDDREPHWSPDGAQIAFSSDRGGSYDVWALTLATGELRQVTSNPANDYMPAWSPDGRLLAFVSDRRDGPGVWAIEANGQSERLITEAAGAVAGPSWSPDGSAVAFNLISGGRSRLVTATPAGLRDLADAGEDVFPFRPQWASAREMLYTSDGKIKRRSIDGGPSSTIEFSAGVSFTRAPFTPRRRAFAPAGPQPTRGIMHPAMSPDGRQVAFAALGDLWLMPIGADPRRITHDPFVETDPAWSPDGASLAFSSDRDGAMHIWVRDVRSGTERRLTASAGIELQASWAPDGTRIAFVDAEGQVQIADARTGSVTRAHDRLNEPGRPAWSPDGQALVMSSLRTYSTRFREGTNQLLRVSLTGQADRWFDPAPHKSAGMRQDYGPVWSPDGQQMAAIIDGRLSVWPVSRDGSPAGAIRQLTTELAGAPAWAADSRRLFYQTDDRFAIVDTIDGRTEEIVPSLTWTPHSPSAAAWPSAGPSGPAGSTITVHAGRVWDGRGDALRENVDLVITGTRITRVEAHRAALHTGTVVDASNQTVIPGLIESHAHLSTDYGEALGRIWLSWGITTVRNPASHPFEGQEQREAIESGARVGPRVFTTGDPFDGTRIYYPGGAALDGGAQLALQLRRADRLGYDLIKTYVRLPDLLQKRVIEEAHRLGMPVTSHELYPAVAYGVDGVEHIRGTSRRGYSPKVTALNHTYHDVIDLLAASKMTLTPTINIQGGFPLQTLRDPSWLDDARIRQLYPASVTASSRALLKQPSDAVALAARARLIEPQEKLVFDVVKAGGRVIAGTDAPINPYGLSLLSEIEHYVAGGLSPVEALRTATTVPAAAMGVAADLGTLEAGKLADLTMLDGNPLASIKDLRKVRRVIKDGVVYELDALLRGPARTAGSSAAR